MPISKIISNLAQSKVGKNFCTYIANPKNEKFVNSTLPTCQQFLSEIVGISIVAFNSKIEPEQKKSQLINHGLKAITNLTVVGATARGAASFAQNVAKNLDAKGVSKNIQQGVKVGFPLLTAVLFSRYLIPVLLNPISSGLRDKLNEKILNRSNSNKLKNKDYEEILFRSNPKIKEQKETIFKKLDYKA